MSQTIELSIFDRVQQKICEHLKNFIPKEDIKFILIGKNAYEQYYKEAAGYQQLMSKKMQISSTTVFATHYLDHELEFILDKDNPDRLEVVIDFYKAYTRL